MHKISYFKYLILLFPIITFFSCNEKNELKKNLHGFSAKTLIELGSYKDAHQTDQQLIPIKDLILDTLLKLTNFQKNEWLLTTTIQQESNNQTFKFEITAELLDSIVEEFSLGMVLKMDKWDIDNYVLFPAAAYNGNRYNAIRKRRRQHFCDTVPCSPTMEPIISDVSRLSIDHVPTSIQLLAGDLSTPSVGFYDKQNKQGMIILTKQGTNLGDYSFKLEESINKKSANITIRIPGIREDSCFKGETRYPSPDKGVTLKKGQKITLQLYLHFFESESLSGLFSEFIKIRKSGLEQILPEELPLSEAWKLQEQKYNEQNWVEQYGYFSVGMRESTYQDWQTGWVGGMNAVYPLLLSGNELTKKRALKTFDFLFKETSQSGFFYDVFYNGKWEPLDGMSFLRRNSDALYFIIKSFQLLETQDSNYIIPDHWKTSTRNCANAYVKLYNKYGQFGQWIDYKSGDIIAGSTASNGIAPGALYLCFEYFKDSIYKDIALKSAEYYYQNFVRIGLTNGGPGDIWQCPDSESAFGLLETFVLLYEKTQDKKWLQYAIETANQAATWVVSYDFKFPSGSTFDNLKMKTNGTVIANVQNKHSAPGICTLSGNSLFKLYRYTQDPVYLDIICDIARSIPQYISRNDRPIVDPRPGTPVPSMPSGWINERVNMSDWEERGNPGDIKRGEIFGGSTWSEVASMLSYSELPGIYVLTDKKIIGVFDNLQARIISSTNDSVQIQISNNTKYPSTTNIFYENSINIDKPYNFNIKNHNIKLTLKPGEMKYIMMKL